MCEKTELCKIEQSCKQGGSLCCEYKNADGKKQKFQIGTFLGGQIINGTYEKQKEKAGLKQVYDKAYLFSNTLRVSIASLLLTF